MRRRLRIGQQVGINGLIGRFMRGTGDAVLKREPLDRSDTAGVHIQRTAGVSGSIVEWSWT